MSELKEYLFVPCSELQEGDELTDAITISKSYYDKYEADKVIAHQKYKRCLAMASLCSSHRFAWSFIPEDDEVHKSDFYKKWYKRWLELAEKFKPNN